MNRRELIADALATAAASAIPCAAFGIDEKPTWLPEDTAALEEAWRACLADCSDSPDPAYTITEETPS